MRLFNVTFALVALSSVLGAYNGNKVAKHIDATSKVIKPGQYRFVNVKSKKALTYYRSNQQLYAQKGKGSMISIKDHHHHVVMSPSSSNDKCVSAQWNYARGANWAGALYACSVAHFKRSGIPVDDLEVRSIPGNVLDLEVPDFEKRDNASLEKRDPPLRGAKQYFYVHPGAQAHTYHIVAQDHLTDMPATALSDCHVTAVGNKRAKYACLVKLNDKDKSQLWYIYNKKGQRL